MAALSSLFKDNSGGYVLAFIGIYLTRSFLVLVWFGFQSFVRSCSIARVGGILERRSFSLCDMLHPFSLRPCEALCPASVWGGRWRAVFLLVGTSGWILVRMYWYGGRREKTRWRLFVDGPTRPKALFCDWSYSCSLAVNAVSHLEPEGKEGRGRAFGGGSSG